MASSPSKITLSSIETLYENGESKKALQEIEELIDSQGATKPKLLWKMKIEDSLGMTEDALNTCNLLLFYDPMNKDAHQTKLKLLKRQRKFQYITEYLSESIKMFPISGLSGMNLREKFKFS